MLFRSVRIFDSAVREHTVEFRLFKDLNDNTRFYGVRSKKVFLEAQLNPTDSWIYLTSVDSLQSPEPATNTAGVVVINGERITYGIIDSVNNRLGNIRRGTGGTGIYTHAKGTMVTDSGSLVEIPNSRETYTTVTNPTYLTNGIVTLSVPAGGTIRQGTLLTTIGQSIQTTNSTYAQFIRAL